MKYFATISAFVSVIPGILSLTMNTPTSVVQCQPQMLTWSDGTAPYYITIIPGGQPSAAPIKSFDTQPGNSLSFTVDIPGGTRVSFALKDSTGATAYTDMVTVQQNSDLSCMNPSQANVAAAASSPAPPAAPAAPAAAPAAANSGAAAPAGAISGALAVTSSTGAAATRAVTTTVAAQATQPASRPSTTMAPGASTTPGSTTSGAQSRYTLGGSVFAAALGLLGALFL